MSADLLSGKELIKYIQNYLNRPQIQALPLKKTSKGDQNDFVQVYVLRCAQFESLIQLLEDKAIVGLPATQHNILQVFLHETILQGHAVLLEQQIDERFIIDLVVDGNIYYELKVKRNVDYRQIEGYMNQYLDDMIAQSAFKHRWFLAFFSQRADAKAKKGGVCIYYLVVIELMTQSESMKQKNRKKLVKHVQEIVDTAVQTVVEEDQIEPEPEDAALLPVKNVLLMERLRAEKKQLIVTLAGKDQALAEKDRIITELKKKLNQS